MAGETSLDSSVMDDVQTKLKALMDDESYKHFAPLVDPHPDAGNWPAAQWLERIVDDRRNAMVEHAKRLRTMFTKMQEQLTKVTEDLSGTDKDNAAALKDVQDMRTAVSGAVSTDAAQTEVDQTNFSDNGKDPGDNASDGDGYDDNLTKPLGLKDPPAPPAGNSPAPAPPPPPADPDSGGKSGNG